MLLVAWEATPHSKMEGRMGTELSFNASTASSSLPLSREKEQHEKCLLSFYHPTGNVFVFNSFHCFFQRVMFCVLLASPLLAAVFSYSFSFQLSTAPAVSRLLLATDRWPNFDSCSIYPYACRRAVDTRSPLLPILTGAARQESKSHSKLADTFQPAARPPLLPPLQHHAMYDKLRTCSGKTNRLNRLRRHINVFAVAEGPTLVVAQLSQLESTGEHPTTSKRMRKWNNLTPFSFAGVWRAIRGRSISFSTRAPPIRLGWGLYASSASHTPFWPDDLWF